MKVEKVIPLQICEHPRFEETLAFLKKCINKKMTKRLTAEKMDVTTATSPNLKP